MARLFETLDRENIGSRQPATERDDFRPLRDLQKLSNGGTFDSQRALRVPRLPERRHGLSSRLPTIRCQPPQVSTFPKFQGFKVQVYAEVLRIYFETLKP